MFSTFLFLLTLFQPSLIQHIFNSDSGEVLRLLEQNEDSSDSGGHGCSAAEVKQLDAEKRSPLHAAAFMADLDIVEIILDHVDNVNVKDNQWRTPLHRACRSSGEVRTSTTCAGKSL